MRKITTAAIIAASASLILGAAPAVAAPAHTDNGTSTKSVQLKSGPRYPVHASPTTYAPIIGYFNWPDYDPNHPNFLPVMYNSQGTWINVGYGWAHTSNDRV